MQSSYGLQIWQSCSQGYSGHDPFKIFRKEGVARDARPPKFWGLNANCSNMAQKDTDFKFQKHVPWADSERISMTGSAVSTQYTRVTDVRATELPWHIGYALQYSLHIRPDLLSQVKK